MPANGKRIGQGPIVHERPAYGIIDGMDEGANDFEFLLRRAESGDHDALGLACERFRGGLKNAVRMRLEP
jgi:hypothetical protein